MARQRYVRRQSWTERILGFINIYDHFLALTTELDSYDVDPQAVGLPIAVVLNVLAFLSAANSGGTGWSDSDVLMVPDGRGGYTIPGRNNLGVFCYFASWSLGIAAAVNALVCFGGQKRYRFFEKRLDAVPSTPSAHRVSLDASPTQSSPMRLIGSVMKPITGATKEKVQSIPGEDKDVWEVAAWRPSPISLYLFSTFSPIHILIYWLSLPIAGDATSPATTYITVIVTILLVSAQNTYLTKAFLQQSKDDALIHKEVFNEYDIKYVNPRLNKIYRDVATSTESGGQVEAYVPQTLRSPFTISANPAYRSYTESADSTTVPESPNLRNIPQPRFPMTPKTRRSMSPIKRTVGRDVGNIPGFSDISTTAATPRRSKIGTGGTNLFGTERRRY